MKYCIFTAQYLPNFGGVEQYTYNLAVTLYERGHEVIIVSSCTKDAPSFIHISECYTLYRIPSLNLLNGRMPIAYPSKKWMELKHILDNQKIDRIIIQTRLYTLSIMGMRYAANNNIPMITIEHGSGYVGMNNKILQMFEHCYENILLMLAKHYCKNYCTVSASGIEWLHSLGIRSKAVLYNSVNEQRIEHFIKGSSISWRAKLNISPNSKIIVFAGRLIREKGILQLIDAVIRLSTEFNIVLLIAGDGPLFSKINAIRSQNIILLGRLKQQDIMPLLNQSDIFCLPSDSEGFPTSILEAIVCKCFVITSPYGGAKEIISSKKYGHIMKDNLPETIYGDLKEILLAKEEYLTECINQAYLHFINHFTWKHTCDVLEALPWNEYSK